MGFVANALVECAVMPETPRISRVQAVEVRDVDDRALEDAAPDDRLRRDRQRRRGEVDLDAVVLRGLEAEGAVLDGFVLALDDVDRARIGLGDEPRALEDDAEE